MVRARCSIIVDAFDDIGGISARLERDLVIILLGTTVHAVPSRNIHGPHAVIDEEQRQKGDGKDNNAEHCERYWGRGFEK